MFCKNCGKNIDGFDFCPNCGTKSSDSEKNNQQAVVVTQTISNQKPVQVKKPVKVLPQSPKAAKNVFIFGLMSLVLFALPVLLYFGYIWFLEAILNRSLESEYYRNLAYMIPIGSAIAVIIAIIAKLQFSNYIKTNEDYPGKVRTGRILYTVAFTVGIVLLSFFCIDRLCHFIL